MAHSELIGVSPAFQAVIGNIHLVAHTDSSVLIQGETGTGKEVIARAIHMASNRRDQRFVAVNCAAIPGALLESDLFGHERGSFTGAVMQKLGRFQMADRGTLFLDEIGDLPLELQPKLLRALQEQQIERVGSNRSMQVNVRVIAATNQDLGQMVQAKQFRADLYYRLNVFPVELPPLRERRDDIPLLVRHFVQQCAARQGKSITHIPESAIEAFKNYDWPGNIRELQNSVERAVIRTTGSVLQIFADEFCSVESCSTSGRTLEDALKVHITTALRNSNWVIGGTKGAAARLGLPRTTLISRMNKLGINGPR